MSQFQEWNREGLIPGPNETEEEFNKRALYCLQLKEELVRHCGTDLPFHEQDLANQGHLEEAFIETSRLYGIAPHWVPLIFNNSQLAPWHGGCTWVFQIDDKSPTAAFLQLRDTFRRKSTYLGFYHRQELIAHELAHVGRMMYQEPQFEEILAYRASTSSWRAWLGPIIQSAKESLLFIVLLGIVILANLALLSWDNPQSERILLTLELMPTALVLYALVRLARRHRQFNRCLATLTLLYENRETAQHLMYRLTDLEIRTFSEQTPVQIHLYIEEQSIKSFRWRFLKDSYPIFSRLHRNAN